KANETITRTVRLDQGSLAAFLSQNPSTQIDFYPSVRTNVIGVPGGGVTSGPGGFTRELAKPVGRSAFPINPGSIQQLIALTNNGDASQKFCGVQLIGNLANAFRAQKDNPDVQRQGDLMLETVAKTIHDNDQSVAAWAMYLTARYGNENQRESTVNQMLGDE